MTRKHFEAVAEVLAAEHAIGGETPFAQSHIRNITLSLADVFSRENPRFDRPRFFVAAGLTEEGFIP